MKRKQPLNGRGNRRKKATGSQALAEPLGTVVHPCPLANTGIINLMTRQCLKQEACTVAGMITVGRLDQTPVQLPAGVGGQCQCLMVIWMIYLVNLQGEELAAVEEVVEGGEIKAGIGDVAAGDAPRTLCPLGHCRTNHFLINGSPSNSSCLPTLLMASLTLR